MVNKLAAMGEYEFFEDQFGPDGPQSGDIGYVVGTGVTEDDYPETYYLVVFENHEGWYIGLEDSGTYHPYQETLF